MKKFIASSAVLLLCAGPLGAGEAPQAVESAPSRDPFNAPAAKGAAAPDVKQEISNITFVLEGLVWESERPQAIVNGKIVTRGSEVEGAEVLDISQKGVRMRYKGQEFILRPRGRQP